MNAVTQLGYEQPTPIQSASIPSVLMGRDILGSAQTGTGKTASFTLPMIDILAAGRAKARMPRSLILAPTRELAAQVAESFEKFSVNHKMSMALLIGGVSFSDQDAALSKGVDVLIATPGRLLDHFERGKVLLQDVKILVIDEADRMLDMGFRDDVEKILQKASPDRQTIFFSATISSSIKALVEKFSTNPRYITVKQGVGQEAPLVTEKGFKVKHQMKFDALLRLLQFYDAKSGVIFCNTQQMVEKLSEDLATNGCIVDRLHGGMAQAQRERVMANFRKSRFHYLVATDVAARGIDVNDLGVVINYDLPKDPEDYVHRVGRTGRAGKKGLALSLVTGAGMRSVATIERFTGAKLTIEKLPSHSAIRSLQSDKLLDSLRIDLKKNDLNEEKKLVQKLLDEGCQAEDIAAVVLQRLLPEQNRVDHDTDDVPDGVKRKRQKRRERPNSRREPRKKRRIENQRSAGKRVPRKRKFHVKVQK